MPENRSPARSKHLIYPLFMPNQGCPGKCIYCDQARISGAQTFDLDKAVAEVAEFVRHHPAQAKEVAFYGGTFTGLPQSRRDEILSRILAVVDDSTALRISTHPLWISEEILQHCADNRIQTIELGIQDWHDRPLAASGRGYTSAEAIRAARMVKDKGFTLGVQLMPGLPGSDDATLRYNHEVLAALKPDLLRLYPVVVIRGTKLSQLYEQGLYQPLSLDEAVSICADYAILCAALGIKIIKYGLPSNIATDDVIAGAFHPAFGELVKQELLLQSIKTAEHCSNPADRERHPLSGCSPETGRKNLKRHDNCTKYVSTL